MASEYAELRQIVREYGLFKKQPVYYLWKALATFGMLVGCVLLMADNLWIAAAVLLAFTFGQSAFLGHDIGHKQVFQSETANVIFGLLISCLLLGISRSAWIGKHNAHHAHPNNPELDPDAVIPIFAFSRDQALNRHGLFRFMISYQVYYFIPALSLVSITLRAGGIIFLVRNIKKAKKRFKLFAMGELAIMALHFFIYGFLLFHFWGIPQAIIFTLIHQLLFGMYMGYVFAPNHKGMPISDGSESDTLRMQVLTARNIKSNRFITFLYGGLDYQIEHHLFPTMPRNNLKEAQKVVKDFCNEHRIPYHEVDIITSNLEILRHLDKVGATLRSKPARA